MLVRLIRVHHDLTSHFHCQAVVLSLPAPFAGLLWPLAAYGKCRAFIHSLLSPCRSLLCFPSRVTSPLVICRSLSLWRPCPSHSPFPTKQATGMQADRQPSAAASGTSASLTLPQPSFVPLWPLLPWLKTSLLSNL